MTNNTITIGDVCRSVSETFHSDGDVVLINTSDVLDGKMLNHKYVPNNDLKGQFKKTFQKDDILFSEIRPQNRRFAYVDCEAKNYIASTKLMVLRVDTTKILPKFFYYYITNQNMLDKLQHIAETRSGTFPQITFSELSAMRMPKISLAHQEAVIKILKSLDDKIELNNKINENLEQQAQAIFKSWFVDFEPFCGKMPEGWCMMSLRDVSKIAAGGDKPQDVNSQQDNVYRYPVFANGITQEGLYAYTKEPTVDKESVTVSARGTIGFVCLRHVPYTPIVRLIYIVPNTNILTAKFLYLYLRRMNISGTGTTQQQLTVPDFQKTEILIPRAKEIQRFTDIVTPQFETIWHNEEQNKKLAELRDSLLPKLISGEIDVSNVKI